MPRLLAVLLCLLMWLGVAQAQSTAAAPGAPMPVNDPAALAALLRDDARRAELIATLEALSRAASIAPPSQAGAVPAAPAPSGAPQAAPAAPTQPGSPAAPASPSPASGAVPANSAAAEPPADAQPLPLVPDSVGARLLLQASEVMARISAAVRGGADAVTDLSGLEAWATAVWSNPWLRERVIATAWKVTAMLATALLAQFLLHRALRVVRARLQEGGPLAWIKRLPRALGVLALELVPLAGAYVVGTAALTLLEPVLTTRVIALSLLNALIVSGAVMRLARFVLSPGAPRLRLVTMAEDQVAGLLRALRRSVGLAVFGVVALDAALLFGLDRITYGVLLRVLLAVVAVQFALLVLRLRGAVASAIRAPSDATGTWALLRNRLAGWWHVLAILYIGAAYAVWALAITDGFSWLLTRSLLTVGVLVGLRIGEEAIGRAETRAAAAARTIDPLRHPGLLRLSRRLPLVGRLALAVLRVTLVVLLFEIWGFGAFAWFEEGRLGRMLVSTLGSIAATLGIALLLWELVNAGIERRMEALALDAQAARSARVRTLLPLMRTAFGVLVVVTSGLIVLSEIGVNIAPLLAGAGVIGLAVGFGSQTLVRDVITGAFLLFEDAIAVGDVVTVAGVGGVVEALSIRSIKLRSVDGSVHIIPFSAVTTVTNMTKDYAFAVLDISVAYKEETDKVIEVMKAVGNDIRAEDRWAAVIREPLEVFGIETLGDSAVTIRARFKTDPGSRWAVGREYRRRIKMAFEHAGIEIPYPHQKVVYEGAIPGTPLAQPLPAD